MPCSYMLPGLMHRVFLYLRVPFPSWICPCNPSKADICRSRSSRHGCQPGPWNDRHRWAADPWSVPALHPGRCHKGGACRLNTAWEGFFTLLITASRRASRASSGSSRWVFQGVGLDQPELAISWCSSSSIDLAFHAAHTFRGSNDRVDLEDIVIARADKTADARPAQFRVRILHPTLHGFHHLLEEELIRFSRDIERWPALHPDRSHTDNSHGSGWSGPSCPLPLFHAGCSPAPARSP